MGLWSYISAYGLIGIIVLTLVLIIVRRRITATRKYAALSAGWRQEGYERIAVSEAGAALWQNTETRSLICARENTERFTVLPFSDICAFAVYDDNALLVCGEVGKPPVYGEETVSRRKCDNFHLVIRRADHSLTEMVLTSDSLRRDSREYKEARRTAERFAEVLFTVKESNESAMGIAPVTDEAVFSELTDPVQEKLERLRRLQEKGLISREQCDRRITEILREI